MVKNLFSMKTVLIGFLWLFTALPHAAQGKESRELTVNLSGYNHTDHGVGSYEVTLQNGATAGAGYLDAGQGGGGLTCCLSIPRVWQAGMTANIVMHTIKNGKDIRVEQTVPVPKYAPADAGRFVVHFLCNGKYKVFVTRYLLGHRKYPLSGTEAQLERGVPIEIIWE
ncbi:DUF3304 domain-containing protein [Janthinobacterium sp. SUN120]|uniref:DUF3304 domain-containing protein n=1 Tax=Janthinobacterium sp. SUN120 TaxID=3004099 RepID=UPI0025B1CE99|nr:DUF3304 domain-containing protein [Janthinobacterium sp. SUN120]MDN2714301.1 DUF3304 domain-containing protein [Janthinobacterium sp. SUN120]